MRPGLHKPGALPLLALIVFSLLTLAPSLPSIYNLKLTDLTYFVHGAHRECNQPCIGVIGISRS